MVTHRSSRRPATATAVISDQTIDGKILDVMIADSGSSTKYKIDERLGGGGYGQVHLGRKYDKERPELPDEVAVKFERKRRSKYGTPYEWEVYRALQCIQNSQTGSGLPTIHCLGSIDDHYYMVMDRLEKIEKKDIRFDSISSIACQAIQILKNLHSKGYVHGDVKPGNLMNKQDEVILIDFGLASRWKKSSTGKHVEYDQRINKFRGTKKYASVHALLGRTASRRDDLISLAYSLISLYHDLPWKDNDDHDHACKMKTELSLCSESQESLKIFFEAVVKLKFDEEPQYDVYKSWFENITDNLAQPNQPTKVNFIYQTGQTQWVTILTGFRGMMQRYHYDVDASMFECLLGLGSTEGFHISSVVSRRDGWTLILDKLKPCTEQVYKHASGFLNESHELTDWVMNNWKNDYKITALGACDRSSLVVMSKGVDYGVQIAITDETFPYNEICKRWRDGYFITALAASGCKWTVVMSRKAGFSQQIVEIDVCFPAEGVGLRWSQGYRITAVAAAEHKPERPGRVVVVMSIRKGNPTREKQVILGTPHFPRQEIKEYWLEAHVTSICYGSLYFESLKQFTD